MALTQLKLFSVPISDPERAKSFYADTLGLRVLEDQEMGPGMRWIRVQPPGGGTSITLVTWFETMPAGSQRGTIIETDALEADRDALIAKGVEMGEIETMPWGRYSQFTDPDGNGLMIQETAPDVA